MKKLTEKQKLEICVEALKHYASPYGFMYMMSRGGGYVRILEGSDIAKEALKRVGRKLPGYKMMTLGLSGKLSNGGKG